MVQWTTDYAPEQKRNNDYDNLFNAFSKLRQVCSTDDYWMLVNAS